MEQFHGNIIMGTKQSNSYRLKRMGENDEDRESKYQRLESPDESMPKLKRITDLNNDCLVEIFGYLDLQHLFNIAIANEWMRPAARDVYKRKFGLQPVQIFGCDDYSRPNEHSVATNDHEIEYYPIKEMYGRVYICGLKTCLLYLRCFGSSINDLTICYYQSQIKRYDYIHEYINDYCAESLTHLSFSEMPNITIERSQTIFANVQSVEISYSDLEEQLPSFKTCFPNMHRLYMNQVRMGNYSIAIAFQHLVNLRIDGCTTIELKTKFVDLLRMNRQLKCLRINIICSEFSPPHISHISHISHV